MLRLGFQLVLLALVEVGLMEFGQYQSEDGGWHYISKIQGENFKVKKVEGVGLEP